MKPNLKLSNKKVTENAGKQVQRDYYDDEGLRELGTRLRLETSADLTRLINDQSAYAEFSRLLKRNDAVSLISQKRELASYLEAPLFQLGQDCLTPAASSMDSASVVLNS